MGLSRVSAVVFVACLLIACGAPTAEESAAAPRNVLETAPVAVQATTAGSRLRLATTTSTDDSGLLKAILPDYERKYGATVDVVAVGTGQALKLGENGDADVVLVHARKREDEFVAQGFGTARRDVMYNDFVIVGPSTDPAGIKGSSQAADALEKIASSQSPFFSRGDDSGTHAKELALWSTASISPTAHGNWYKSLGQGMGETLIVANEQRGYTLADRGTFLSMRDKLPDLTIVVGGETIAENRDKSLLNPYGVIPVNPAKHPRVHADLAAKFVEWITSPETQQAIGKFGVDRFGQALFYAAPAQ